MLNKHMRINLAFIGSALILLMVAAFSRQAMAAQALVAQGYGTDGLIQNGMIVRLDPTNSSKVMTMDLSHMSKMLGVIVSGNESALTIGQSTSGQEVYVSNTGQHDVLVSSQNGSISIGDYITISSLAGIGMKADPNEAEVLGQAAGNFNANSNSLSNVQLNIGSGQKQTVSIGLIPVTINIEKNPLFNQGSHGIPSILSNITKYATNKSVSATRVYLGMLCVLAGMVVTITLIYSAIKSSFISIGRNPLAKKAIMLNLIRVLIISILIFGISLGAAYLIISQ